MAHHIEKSSMPSYEHLTPQIHRTPQIHPSISDEIEERRRVDHLIEMEQINGEDRSCLQTNIKSTNQIFAEMFEDLDNLSIESCTIFKVNVGLRESNPGAYTPKMISIGPYHKRNLQLHPMEKYKLLYLRRFLQQKRGLDVESCMSELGKTKEEALKCYDNMDDLYNDTTLTDQFLLMLLVDGCFVVEFIRERFGRVIEHDRFVAEFIRERFGPEIGRFGQEIEYDIIEIEIGRKREPDIIKDDFIVSQIRRDLLLLENQLPLFVLTMLHELTKQENELPVIQQAGFVFADILPKVTVASLKKLDEAGNFKHLLHMVHTLCQPLETKSTSRLTGESSNIIPWRDRAMPNATELSEAGVKFKKLGLVYREEYQRAEDSTRLFAEDSTRLFDIKFEDGVMKIPSFIVNDFTETLLRNLIAYEQHTFDVSSRYSTDFAIFMDYLIDTDKDVSLLRRKGIIWSRIGADKEVASLFDKLAKGVVNLDEVFNYEEETKRANQYCKKLLNRTMASLQRNYFAGPWTTASTVAAIILLIFTAMQTVLAFTGSVKK